jgi:hypothetical protein
VAVNGTNEYGNDGTLRCEPTVLKIVWKFAYAIHPVDVHGHAPGVEDAQWLKASLELFEERHGSRPELTLPCLREFRRDGRLCAAALERMPLHYTNSF